MLQTQNAAAVMGGGDPKDSLKTRRSGGNNIGGTKIAEMDKLLPPNLQLIPVEHEFS